MISRSIIEEIKLLFTKKDYEAALKAANEKTKITERPAGLLPSPWLAPGCGTLFLMRR